MLIDLKTIPREGKRTYELSLNESWWNPENGKDQILGLKGPLSVIARIYRAGKRYILEGTISGILKIVCDRCLHTYYRDLKSDFNISFAAQTPDMENAEIELLEDDLDIGFIRDEEIDMGRELRAYIPARCEHARLSAVCCTACQPGCL